MGAYLNKKVSAHEMGHALGLLHSDDRKTNNHPFFSIMSTNTPNVFDYITAKQMEMIIQPEIPRDDTPNGWDPREYSIKNIGENKEFNVDGTVSKIEKIKK